MEKTYSFKTLVNAVALAVVTTALLTAVGFRVFVLSPNSELDAYNAKLSEINSLVEKYYVGDVDEKVMADYLAAGYTAGLGDKYAQYISVEEAAESLNSFQGVNAGIGVQISSHPDSLNVFILDVHKGSPAEKAGLKSGDQIVKINDKKVIPKKGVYYTNVDIEGKIFKGITSVGNNPTVNGKELTIETYILDFNNNIYEKEIKNCKFNTCYANYIQLNRLRVK